MSFWYPRRRRSDTCRMGAMPAWTATPIHQKKWDALSFCNSCCCEFFYDSFKVLNTDSWTVASGEWEAGTPPGFMTSSLRTASTSAELVANQVPPAGPYRVRLTYGVPSYKTLKILWNYRDADNHFYHQIGPLVYVEGSETPVLCDRVVCVKNGRETRVLGTIPDTTREWTGESGTNTGTLDWIVWDNRLTLTPAWNTHNLLGDILGFVREPGNAWRIQVTGTGSEEVSIGTVSLSRVEVGCGTVDPFCFDGRPNALEVTLSGVTTYPPTPGFEDIWPCQDCGTWDGVYVLRAHQGCIGTTGLWSLHSIYNLGGIISTVRWADACGYGRYIYASMGLDGVLVVWLETTLNPTSGVRLEWVEYTGNVSSYEGTGCRNFTVALSGTVHREANYNLCNYPSTVQARALDL